MLSYSQTYGMGAALLRRPIFSGPARADAGVVVAQIDPYLARDRAGTNNVMLESIANNGAVYLGIGNNRLYTSPDLVTLTERAIGSATQYSYPCAIGATLFCVAYDGGYRGVWKSTDNGVSWNSLSITNYPYLCVAGALGFAFQSVSSASFYTFTGAGVATIRSASVASSWTNALHNASKYLLVNQAGDLAQVSSDGASWVASAGYAAAAALLQANGNPGQRWGYALGTRFVVLALQGGALSSMYSDDGDTWYQGARQVNVAGARPLTSLHLDAVELDGHLYISATANSGRVGLILSTHDGIHFRAHQDYYVSQDATAITAPGLYRRMDGLAFLFNGGGGGATPQPPALQSNPDALELYHEL